MITPHETLVIRYLVGGSWSTGGIHFRVQKQSLLSPRFKVALHSTWFYLFCLHRSDRRSQCLECEDFRRCQNFTWLLIHANACARRTFSVPNVRQTLIILLISTAPCSLANLRTSRRKAAMEILKKWDEEGKLPSAQIEGKDVPLRGKKKGQSARRNSI